MMTKLPDTQKQNIDNKQICCEVWKETQRIKVIKARNEGI